MRAEHDPKVSSALLSRLARDLSTSEGVGRKNTPNLGVAKHVEEYRCREIRINEQRLVKLRNLNEHACVRHRIVQMANNLKHCFPLIRINKSWSPGQEGPPDVGNAYPVSRRG